MYDAFGRDKGMVVVWEVLLQEISIRDKWICKDVQREKTEMQTGKQFGISAAPGDIERLTNIADGS